LQKLGTRSESLEPTSPATPEPATATLPPVRDDGGRRRRSIILAVVGALLVGALAAVIVGINAARAVPTYQSTAVLSIDEPGAIALSNDDGVIAKLSRLRTKYAGLMRTQVFAQPVADQLGLPVGSVTGAVSVAADPASLLLIVGARSSDGTRAHDIAEAVAEHLVDYVQDEQTANEIPEPRRVSFAVVTPASNPVKTSPTDRRVTLESAGAFVLAAGLTIGIVYVGRRRF
jgi:capsular polysaccharide biosynthesis protein